MRLKTALLALLFVSPALAADKITLAKPAGWDVSQSEDGAMIFAKPLGVSGVRIVRIASYPPEPNPNFAYRSAAEIDSILWKLPWRDPTFWQTEPTTELPQSYSAVSAVDITVRGEPWTCVRHSGPNVSDIGICFTKSPNGVVTATYLSKSANVSQSEADVQLEDVQQVLNGLSF